jgi:hypothetical protein
MRSSHPYVCEMNHGLGYMLHFSKSCWNMTVDVFFFFLDSVKSSICSSKASRRPRGFVDM